MVMVIRWRIYIKKNNPSGYSLALIRNLMTLLILLSITNLMIGWTLGIINICYLAEPGRQKDLLHSIQPIGKDLLTAFFSIGYLLMSVLVMLILNVGVFTKWQLQVRDKQAENTVSVQTPSTKQMIKKHLNVEIGIEEMACNSVTPTSPSLAPVAVFTDLPETPQMSIQIPVQHHQLEHHVSVVENTTPVVAQEP